MDITVSGLSGNPSSETIEGCIRNLRTLAKEFTILEVKDAWDILLPLGTCPCCNESLLEDSAAYLEYLLTNEGKCAMISPSLKEEK